MRKSKENDEQVSYLLYRGNVTVHIPTSVELEAGNEIANDISDSMTDCWLKMEEIYGSRVGSRIGEVVVTDEPIKEDHPYVVWHIASRRIWLLNQDDMIKWFMLELHNVFRYRLHGTYGAIYNPVSDEDRMNALTVQDYINDNWRMYG